MKFPIVRKIDTFLLLMLLFPLSNLAQQPTQPLRNTIGEIIIKFESTEAFQIPTDPFWVWKFKEIPPTPDGITVLKAELRKVSAFEKWWLERKLWIQSIGGGSIFGLFLAAGRYLLKNKKLVKELLQVASALEKEKKRNDN